ncbi:GNAT family N-acetyltransferase [Pediococcus siamensis]|uniref:GNAT family N-acetyltransferase n=1 Tax=Pediococcus siamensis TaxID=381829 RepID=UPI00399F315F
MKINFHSAIPDDLSQIMRIENAGFSSAEAATETAMQSRIQTISDSFIVATNEDNLDLGYVVGPVIAARHLTDDLFTQTKANPATGGYQSILSLAVAPDWRNYGVAGSLLNELKKISQANQRQGITLTCLANLIPYYEKHGYKVDGQSASKHAGEIWYDMVLDLTK